MINKFNKKSGATLLELLIAVTIFLIVVGGMLATYLLIQRAWRSGEKQLIIQSEGWQAMKRISKDIRASADVNPSSGNTNTIILSRPINADGVVVKYHFWYDADEDAIYHNISYDEEALNEDNEIVIIDRVVIESGEYLFNISGKNVTVNFKIRDPFTQDGYQGFDLHTKVTLRNQ